MDEGGGRSTSLYLLAGFLGLFTLLTVAGFMMGWRTDVVTREGEGIDGVITYLLWTTGALVVIGHVVLIWFLWKYTASKAAAYNRPNKRMQMLWGLLPVVVLLLVSEGGGDAAGTVSGTGTSATPARTASSAGSTSRRSTPSRTRSGCSTATRMGWTTSSRTAS